MFNIQGDGSHRKTFIWKDGVAISYKRCTFKIDSEECIAEVDGECGTLDRMVLSGVYLIVSEGKFENSKIIFCDAPLRGVQRLVGRIAEGQHPMLALEAVLLPNIVEAEGDV